MSIPGVPAFDSLQKNCLAPSNVLVKEFARLQVTFWRLAEVPDIKGVNNILGTIATTKASWWWIGADLTQSKGET